MANSSRIVTNLYGIGIHQNVGKILDVFDARSDWMEAFPVNERTTVTVGKCLPAVFARFGKSTVLVSDNGSEYVSDAFKTGHKSEGVHKMESPIYHPRANRLAETATLTTKHKITPTSTNDAKKNTSNVKGKGSADLVADKNIRILPA